MSRPVAYGIDFGTTNSSISIAYPSEAVLVPLGPKRSDVMPSIIYLDESRQRLAGDLAVQQYGVFGRHPTTRLMSSIKSFLADESWIGTQSPWGEFLEPEDLVAILLGALKSEADRYCGEQVTRVVLGHPVLFVGADGVNFARHQELAMKRLANAARIAGFSEIAFCDEASAALSPEFVDDGVVIALDFGGGTFDISVEEVIGGRRKVLATHGAAIGGERFDQLLFDHDIGPILGFGAEYERQGRMLPVPHALRRMNTLHGILDMVGDSKTRDGIELMLDCKGGDIFKTVDRILYGGHGYNFYRAVEAAKIALSTEPSATFTFSRPEIDLSAEIGQQRFEALIDADLARVEQKVLLTLHDAGVSPSDVTMVIRTGGSSKIPAFVKRMAGIFGNTALEERDAFATVALGLGLRALEEWG